MKPQLKAPFRQEEELALMLIDLEELDRDRQANGFYYPPPTIWQTFEKHALAVCGGILFGAAILYLAALLRGL